MNMRTTLPLLIALLATPTITWSQVSLEVRVARVERDIKMIQAAMMTIPAIEETVENAVQRRDGRIYQTVNKAMTDAGVSRESMMALRQKVDAGQQAPPPAQDIEVLSRDFARLAARITELEKLTTSAQGKLPNSESAADGSEALSSKLNQLERQINAVTNNADQVRNELEGVVTQINGSMEILTDDIRTVAEAQNDLDGRARSGYGILADAMQDAIARVENLERVLGSN